MPWPPRGGKAGLHGLAPAWTLYEAWSDCCWLLLNMIGSVISAWDIAGQLQQQCTMREALHGGVRQYHTMHAHGVIVVHSSRGSGAQQKCSWYSSTAGRGSTRAASSAGRGSTRAAHVVQLWELSGGCMDLVPQSDIAMSNVDGSLWCWASLKEGTIAVTASCYVLQCLNS